MDGCAPLCLRPAIRHLPKMSNDRIHNGLIRPIHPYFLSHSAGPLPAQFQQSIAAHFQNPWADQGGEAWGDWLYAIDQFLIKLASLMQTRSSQIAPKPSVTAALLSYLGALAQKTKARTILVAPTHSQA